MVFFPPTGLQLPPRDVSGNFPKAFLQESRAHDLHEVAPLRLPDVPWRTVRHDDMSVTRVYRGPPGRKRDQFVSVTRSSEGELLRHQSCAW